MQFIPIITRITPGFASLTALFFHLGMQFIPIITRITPGFASLTAHFQDLGMQSASKNSRPTPGFASLNAHFHYLGMQFAKKSTSMPTDRGYMQSSNGGWPSIAAHKGEYCLFHLGSFMKTSNFTAYKLIP
jgi:hypothetical protein